MQTKLVITQLEKRRSHHPILFIVESKQSKAMHKSLKKSIGLFCELTELSNPSSTSDNEGSSNGRDNVIDSMKQVL